MHISDLNSSLSVELQKKLGLMMKDATIVPDRNRTELENGEFNRHREMTYWSFMGWVEI